MAISASAQPSSWNQYLKALGPGILSAAAAIGGSHLVASTQAGALYEWQLIGIILLVNILKYPFFLIGARYTISANETLIQGYDRVHRFNLQLFFVLNIIASVISTAGVTMLCGSIFGLFIPAELTVTQLSVIVLIASLIFLITGHYKLLDNSAKWMIASLSVATVFAVLVALNKSGVSAPEIQTPDPWKMAAVGFLVALMGWMPAPIELSAWTSVWIREKQRQLNGQLSLKTAVFDFNVGYFTSTFLALCFVALGALVLHRSGQSLASGGIAFAHQFVDIYANLIGDWSRWLIAFIAFLCMFSTVITVLDGYSRALSESIVQLQQKRGQTATGQGARFTYPIMIVMAIIAAFIIMFFKGALLAMLEFAMIMSFISTVVFAWLNYRLMSLPTVPKEEQFGLGLKILSWIGILFFTGFTALFAYWYFFVK